MTPASGLNKENCPKTCYESRYGCCLDKITSARGFGYAGCPVERFAKRSFNIKYIRSNECKDVDDCDSNSEKMSEIESNNEQIGMVESDHDDVPKLESNNEDAKFPTIINYEQNENNPGNENLTCAQTKFECCPDGVLPALVSFVLKLLKQNY